MASTIFSQSARPFSIEGHRGARGYVPENTIPSFKKALDLDADTLELDVVVTRDGKLVVSHDPWFSSVISLDKAGKAIAADKQRENNIFRMTYDEVKMFDVGSIGNKDFPMQEKMKVVKPLLQDLFKDIAAYVKTKKLKAPRYNIEVKMEFNGDDVFNPKPDVFARLVYDEIVAGKMQKHVIVQSFDVRVLQELRKITKEMPIAMLVFSKECIEKSVERLGFVPDTYSPHFSLIDDAMMAECRKRGIKVIPWTVNEIADLEKMKAFDLDGIISDYPDRVVKIFQK